MSGTLRKIRAVAAGAAAAAVMLVGGATGASAGDVGVQDARGCAFTGGPGIAAEICINVAGVGNHVDRAQGVYTVAPPGFYCGVTLKLFGVDSSGNHWQDERGAGCGPNPYVDWYFGTSTGYFKPGSNLCVGVSPGAGRPYNAEYACITIGS